MRYVLNHIGVLFKQAILTPIVIVLVSVILSINKSWRVS